MTPPLILSDEVAQALSDRRPVVALESTIITHGMPWPDNVETARRVEDEVRDAGAVPATIAIIDGTIRVGLDAPRLEALARATGVAKLSRADLAVCLARGGTGATTVAATMICARLAGMPVSGMEVPFATRIREERIPKARDTPRCAEIPPPLPPTSPAIAWMAAGNLG